MDANKLFMQTAAPLCGNHAIPSHESMDSKQFHGHHEPIVINTRFGDHLFKVPLNVKNMGAPRGVLPEMSLKCQTKIVHPHAFSNIPQNNLETQPRHGNVRHAEDAGLRPLDILGSVFSFLLLTVGPLILTSTNIEECSCLWRT